jgi:DnaJ family protein C protein 8
LDLPYTATEKDIKLSYRKKSLLLHPDKNKHPRAEEAFGLLKKAESEASDETKRANLLEVVKEARVNVIRKHKIAKAEVDAFVETDEFSGLTREAVKTILIENEVRRRKLMKREMELEGAIARKAEEEISNRKRKQEDQKAWEETREKRVSSWRDFQSGKTKKGKSKAGKEFKPPKLVAEDAGKPYIKRTIG